jgi:hypothetical protein
MHAKALRLLLLALLGALLVAAAGCGGGDDEAGSDEPATVAEAPGDETTEPETATTEDEEEADTDESETAAGEEEPDLSDDCLELASLGASLTQALGGTAGDDVEEYGEFLDEFADRTPDEIRDDFRVVADAYAKFVEALGGLDVESGETPDPEALERLQEVSGSIDQQELEQASENISAWVEENCPGG